MRTPRHQWAGAGSRLGRDIRPWRTRLARGGGYLPFFFAAGFAALFVVFFETVDFFAFAAMCVTSFLG